MAAGFIAVCMEAQACKATPDCPPTEPAEHKALDFWVLLLLHSLGPDRRKAAEALLRRKLAEGHTNARWLDRAVVGHEVRGWLVGG